MSLLLGCCHNGVMGDGAFVRVHGFPALSGSSDEKKNGQVLQRGGGTRRGKFIKLKSHIL